MGTTFLNEASFWIFLGGAAATALCFKQRALALVTGCLALAAGLTLVGSICAQTGRPPLSGALESLGFMALVLSMLAMASQIGRKAHLPLAGIAWGAVAVLLAILVWVPRQVNPDWFVYQYLWTRSFFLCRLVSMSLLLYSALTALSWPGDAQQAPVRRRLVLRSRRYLLLGTAIFLVGEVSGFYWCLTWRGDYWLWNRNFLESTMIFLLASAALHLPPKLAANPRALRLVYSLPGLLAITAYLVHQVTEAFL